MSRRKTKKEQLCEMLDNSLPLYGLWEPEDIDCVEGFWKRVDVMRWTTWVGTDLVGCWESVTDCARFGIHRPEYPDRDVADIMISSRKDCLTMPAIRQGCPDCSDPDFDGFKASQE